MYPSHFTVTFTTFQLPLHSGTRCTARTGYRISHLLHRTSGTVQTLTGWWCSRLLDTRVSHHSGNVSGAKVKNRLWWWFLVMMWFWIDDVIFLCWCDVTSVTSSKSSETTSKSVEIIRIVIQNIIFMNIHAQAPLLVKYELITPNSLREGAIQKSISPRCSFRRDWGQNTRYR